MASELFPVVVSLAVPAETPETRLLSKAAGDLRDLLLYSAPDELGAKVREQLQATQMDIESVLTVVADYHHMAARIEELEDMLTAKDLKISELESTLSELVC